MLGIINALYFLIWTTAGVLVVFLMGLLVTTDTIEGTIVAIILFVSYIVALGTWYFGLWFFYVSIGIILGVGGLVITACVHNFVSRLRLLPDDDDLPALKQIDLRPVEPPSDPVIDDLSTFVSNHRKRHDYVAGVKERLRQEFGDDPPEHIRDLIEELDERLTVHRARESR